MLWKSQIVEMEKSFENICERDFSIKLMASSLKNEPHHGYISTILSKFTETGHSQKAPQSSCF